MTGRRIVIPSVINHPEQLNVNRDRKKCELAIRSSDPLRLPTKPLLDMGGPYSAYSFCCFLFGFLLIFKMNNGCVQLGKVDDEIAQRIVVAVHFSFDRAAVRRSQNSEKYRH